MTLRSLWMRCRASRTITGDSELLHFLPKSFQEVFNRDIHSSVLLDAGSLALQTRFDLSRDLTSSSGELAVLRLSFLDRRSGGGTKKASPLDGTRCI